MDSGRRGWLALLIEFVIRLRGGQADHADAQRRCSRLSYESNTSRLGVRMTHFLLNRLRPRWLKLKK